MKKLLLASIIISGGIYAQAADIAGICDYIVMSIPGRNVSLTDNVKGLAEIGWFINAPGDVAINTDCTEQLTLYRNDEPIASLPAIIPSDREDPETGISVIYAGTLDDSGDPLPTLKSCQIAICFSSTPITTPGNYTVYVPEGFFLINGKISEASSRDYVIISPWNAIPVDGSENVSTQELNSFKITYLNLSKKVTAGHKITKWGDDYRKAKLSITFNGEDVTSNYEIKYPTNGGTLTFTTKEGSELSGKGILRLIADTGYFFCDNEALPNIDYSFSTESDTTAIIDVSEAEIYTVYTLDGIRIIKEASEAELKALPAGIYIINGKKSIIK